MSQTVQLSMPQIAEKLAGVKLMICTPAYGGMTMVPFVLSIIDSIHLFNRLGVPVRNTFIENESLITRARNNCVSLFLQQTEYTHLMFIDADIKFDPRDVVSMLLKSLEEPYALLAGVYPKKAINWKMVSDAVKLGVPPGDLPKFTDNPVLNLVPTPNGQHVVSMSEPLEALEVGTGFMLMRREVLDQMVLAYPDMNYQPDYKMNNPEMDKNLHRAVFAFFDTEIVTDETSIERNAQGVRRYLSEDYRFCRLWRKIGGKIWACPWVNLNHHGTYSYQGDLRATLGIRSHQLAQSQKGPKLTALGATGE